MFKCFELIEFIMFICCYVIVVFCSNFYDFINCAEEGRINPMIQFLLMGYWSSNGEWQHEANPSLAGW